MKNKSKYLIMILLAIVTIGSYLISGTYARYTSSASGTGAAQAAKWSFKVNDTEIAKGTQVEGLTFNLFDTANLKEENVTTAETHVASSKIAPGTGGKVIVGVENASEVVAKYSITLTQESNTANIPIEYSLTGNDNDWSTSLTNIKVTNQEIAIGAKNAAAITVYWRWAYKEDGSADESDTAIGIAAQTGTPSVKVKATITATQVD